MHCKSLWIKASVKCKCIYYKHVILDDISLFSSFVFVYLSVWGTWSLLQDQLMAFLLTSDMASFVYYIKTSHLVKQSNTLSLDFVVLC